MLTVALSPVERPPSLLSRLTRYHANAAVTESLLLAPHSGPVTTLQRGQTDAAFTLWVLYREQKPECNKWTRAKLKEHPYISDSGAEYKDMLSERCSPMLENRHMRTLHIH